MGKLFGRDRKASGDESANNLNDFLRGPPDKLAVTHAGPPSSQSLISRALPDILMP